MRYAKFIAAINMLLVSTVTFACAPTIYSPSEYYLFYPFYQPERPKENFNLNSHENCLLWQQQISSSIPIEDIYQMVYKYDLGMLTAMKSGIIPEEAKDNMMVKWIVATKDNEALDFLILAKNCEWLRLQRLSPWYYPSKKDPVRYSLNDVAEMAKQRTQGRFVDRYALQAVRAMTSLNQYDEIVRFWDDVENRLPEGLMRRMTLSFVAGAYVHLNDMEQAKQYYKQADDLEGLLECDLHYRSGMTWVEQMELLYENYPDYPGFRQKIWEIMGRIEPDRDWEEDYWGWEKGQKKEIVELAALCDKVLDGDLRADKALWAYTATYIAHLQGDDKKADRYLKIAESTVKDKDFADAVKVMRIYIDAQISTYDKTYEQKLFAQLRWLQEMIESHIDDEIAEGVNFYDLKICFSYYYWNDAMRCILLGTVCPKMIEKGNTTLALQLANMSSYSLLNEVNRVEFDLWEPKNIAKYGEHAVFNLVQYRQSGLFNDYDYSCHFAEMLDTLSADAAVAYTEVAMKPRTDFQRFLNAHSFIDRDYLNEAIGTHCLREMRYADAERYLSNVAPDFFIRTNVYKEGYLNRDPFSIKKRRWNHGADAKLHFAKTMNRLEHDIAATADPNQKAMLMIDFGIGLRNSFDQCWALTQYKMGWTWGQIGFHDWQDDPNTQKATERAEQLMDKAVNAFTDDEYAAQAQLHFCNYKTIMERYPETVAGEYIKGRCDEFIDYHNEGVR